LQFAFQVAEKYYCYLKSPDSTTGGETVDMVKISATAQERHSKIASM
jgi:hypothetical protein